ncbi:MAG: hypothetical protein R3F30_14970 [Planctomycetota bacterium]
MKREQSLLLGAAAIGALLLSGPAAAQSVTGSATPYGNNPMACPGSGPSEGGPILQINAGSAGGVLLNIEGIHAYEIVVQQTMVVTGFEIPAIFGSGSPSAEPFAKAFLYLGDAKNGPVGAPVRQGLIYIHLGTPGFATPPQRARFRPLTVRQGEHLFVAWEQSSAGRKALLPYSNLARPTLLPFWVESRTGGFQPGPHQAPLVVSLIGPGASPTPGGTPLLTASGEPRKGKTFSVWLDQANAGVGVLVTGAQRYGFGTGSMPVLLPGTSCSLIPSLDVLQAVAIPAGGVMSMPVLVPDDARLVGALLHMQVVVLDRAANKFGMTTTQGLEIKIGG